MRYPGAVFETHLARRSKGALASASGRKPNRNLYPEQGSGSCASVDQGQTSLFWVGVRLSSVFTLLTMPHFYNRVLSRISRIMSSVGLFAGIWFLISWINVNRVIVDPLPASKLSSPMSIDEYVPAMHSVGPLSARILPSNTKKKHPVSTLSHQASSLPELPDRIVVMGKLAHEDSSWVRTSLSDWQHAIYVVDKINATLATPSNKAKEAMPKEAMPYLTYIIDNYPIFPSTIAFIHNHENGYPKAWHTGKKISRQRVDW